MAQMKLNSRLHAALPNPCFDRPFVCDGRPEACTVIILGENPATRLATNWWRFWNNDAGFDLQGFEHHYQASRHAAGKRPISNTRLRLNRLRSQGLRCLEANAFMNERLNGRGAGAISTPLMPMLIANLPLLKAVVAHGVVASEYLSKLSLPQGVETHHVGHFRNLSFAKLDALVQTLL